MFQSIAGVPARRVEILLLLATAAYLFLLLFKLPYHPFYTESDQLIFLYNADRMMSGERMYVNFFQFTFPGGQLLYVILFSVFGIKYWLLPFAIVLVGAASFWLLLRLSLRVIPTPWAYLPPVLFVFFGMRYWGLDGSHRMFCSFFILLAVYFLIKGRGLGHIAAAGISCALASYFTQQRGVVVAVAAGVFLLVDNRYHGRSWGAAAKDVSVLSGVYLVSLAALCAYFIATSSPETFFNSTLLYPTLYYRFHEENNYGAFLLHFQKMLAEGGVGRLFSVVPAVIYGFGVPLAVVVFTVYFLLKGKGKDWDVWRGPVLLATVTGFSIIAITNPTPGRYYLISAPLLVLAVWMISRVEWLNKFRNTAVAGVTVVLLAFASTQAYRAQWNWDWVRIDSPRGTVYALDSDNTKRYLWLLEHTQPGDPVFEVYEPFVYFLLDLRNPSRYTQIFPTNYTRPEFVAGAVEDLSLDPPKYILWDNSYNKPDDTRLPGDHTGPLAKFVQDNYEPVSPIYDLGGQPVQIWAKKGPAS